MTEPVDLGRVRLERDGAVARIIFDRPDAHNAFTWAMYEELDAILASISEDPDLRVVTLRGAGGKAFVAGSDISQFREFDGGADGIAYEAKMNRYFQRILAVPVPTVAIVDGWAVGGGLNIAACCDIRVASRRARFGSPIARTIGNCVSMQTYARVVGGFGEARAKRMLMLAEFIEADEAMAAGFLARLVEPDEIDQAAQEVVERLLENAPITLRVSKAAIGRVLARDIDPADDLIGLTYGSEDFRRGVEAFVSKTKPEWQGR
ncbi:enoyl-CoA hydratase/carnithine racemase [Devosia subaequoris]|uniref:Enoyl-CoA hydratase/carnithine racemase n=1 Tax=Devosia subaequoris TaxID=395930 RepID=A0A7W6NBW5_9HYPH|nr:enoyl-CoA hydratase/isomerase family protein [Devosia subaequoris]MBB4052106.1 enoyl-CoA hydratase/carnithine racemase [Devosia subaequoris]MCP1210269.1 enoyl-CoA hydratase/isomerase family protein [Devosia subaequoris]